MPPVKPIKRIADKWKRVASGAGVEYSEGVKNPKKDWADETAKAETAFEQGIAKAVADKRFGKGVRAAGTSKWQDRAVTVGADRFASGVAASGDNYERGFAPFREVIERTDLPARGAKGDPKNIQRVAVMAKALHDAKNAMRGR